MVQRLNQTSMLPVMNLHASIAVLIRIKYGDRTIGRTVVNDDELELADSFVEYALDGFMQKTVAVKNAHHNRDHQISHGSPLSDFAKSGLIAWTQAEAPTTR